MIVYFYSTFLSFIEHIKKINKYPTLDFFLSLQVVSFVLTSLVNAQKSQKNHFFLDLNTISKHTNKNQLNENSEQIYDIQTNDFIEFPYLHKLRTEIGFVQSIVEFGFDKMFSTIRCANGMIFFSVSHVGFL